MHVFDSLNISSRRFIKTNQYLYCIIVQVITGIHGQQATNLEL